MAKLNAGGYHILRCDSTGSYTAEVVRVVVVMVVVRGIKDHLYCHYQQLLDGRDGDASGTGDVYGRVTYGSVTCVRVRYDCVMCVSVTCGWVAAVAYDSLTCGNSVAHSTPTYDNVENGSMIV